MDEKLNGYITLWIKTGEETSVGSQRVFFGFVLFFNILTDVKIYPTRYCKSKSSQ